MKKILFSSLAAAFLFSTSGIAQERLQLDGTTITGSRALPKVLYIVPWKNSAADINGSLTPDMINESLTAIDRDVFLRHVKYFDALHGKH